MAVPLIPSPIRKVLSSIRQNGVRALLMGGQACVFYGAAEFSRDIDLAILHDPQTIESIEHALADLQAEVIAVPPFDSDYLRRGHAIHFRCRHPEAENLRVDVMSVMRGVDSFDELWERRTTAIMPGDETVELLGLPDLVKAKKTQRDKDWPMIRRLVDANYFASVDAPTDEQLSFWFLEMRTATLLQELGDSHPENLQQHIVLRPLLRLVQNHDPVEHIEHALHDEEQAERERDRLYWLPLRAELEELRRNRPRTIP